MNKQYKIEKYLKDRYEFRYNIVTAKIEFKKIKCDDFKELTDYDLNSLTRTIIKEVEAKYSPSQLNNLLLSDFSPQFDPFKNYIENCGKLDGEIDFIAQLARTVTAKDQEYFNKVFKKWFVALVGSMLESNVINHQLLILIGAQGIGKTRWTMKLIPEELKKYIYNGSINPNNKDTMIHLSENMLINLDELENLTKYQIGSIKELITKPSIKIRRPYGRTTENMVHRASFIGSVNDGQILNDFTGSRRFLCIEVEKINYNHAIEMAKVYAQAYQLYKDGFKYWFDGYEIVEINKRNKEHETLSMEEELLLKYYRKPLNGNYKLVQATEIFNDLASKVVNSNKLTINKLGKALRKNDFERISHNDRKVYKVEKLLPKVVTEVRKELISMN